MRLRGGGMTIVEKLISRAGINVYFPSDTTRFLWDFFMYHEYSYV